MAKRLRLPLAALMAASLLLAPVFTASASAHEVTRVDTRPRYSCEYVYVPEFLAYDAVCEWRETTYTYKRVHIHTSTRVCRWIQTGSITAGALLGTAAGGPTSGIIGGGIGALVGYELCETETGIIWLS